MLWNAVILQRIKDCCEKCSELLVNDDHVLHLDEAPNHTNSACLLVYVQAAFTCHKLCWQAPVPQIES